MPSRLLSLLFCCLSAMTAYAQTPSFKMPRTTNTYGNSRIQNVISRRDAAQIDLSSPKKEGEVEPTIIHDEVKEEDIKNNPPPTTASTTPPVVKADKPKEDKPKDKPKDLEDKGNDKPKSEKDAKTPAKAQKKVENVFRTPEIIAYKYHERSRLTKLEKLEKMRSDLYANAEGSDQKKQFPKDTIAKKLQNIKTLEREIGQLNDQTDSLYYLYTKDVMQYKNASILNFGPLRSRAFFDMLYGNEGKQFKALGNAGINFGTNSASIYSELVSGNLGVARISLGTMITSSNGKDPLFSKQEEAYQRLVTYGGNTVLTAEYPLAYIHSNDNRMNFISRFIVKGSSDLPVFGTNTERFAGSGSLGTDFYADAATGNNALRFFANINATANYGTDIFQQNLGIKSPYFGFGQASLGLVFLDNFKISFIVYTFSTEEVLRNRNVIAGGQILR
jgi:hypothetical protein